MSPRKSRASHHHRKASSPSLHRWESKSLTPVELQTIFMETANICNERLIGLSKPREDGTYSLLTPYCWYQNHLLLGRSSNVLPDDVDLAANLPMNARVQRLSLRTLSWPIGIVLSVSSLSWPIEIVLSVSNLSWRIGIVLLVWTLLILGIKCMLTYRNRTHGIK